MKIYLPILVIIISILSCSKEGEPADGKVNEGIAVDKSTLRDIPLDNGIDSLDITERVKDSIAKVERARLDSIDKVEKAKLQSELDSLKLVEEQNEKINELLTYLENPIEANYNYDWNKKEEKFISDSLGLDLLDQVFRRRQELTIKELTKFIKDVTVSEFKDLWFYESYVWDNNELDSLTLLAYYTKNKIGFSDSGHLHETYVNRTDRQFEGLDTLNYNEINCFLSESRDTLLFGYEYCSFDSFLEKWNLINDEEKYLYQFYILFKGLKINGFEFDLFFSGPEGCADGDESYMRIKNSEGEMRVLEVSRDYGHESYGYFISSRITFDGKFEITVHEYENIDIEFENNQRAKFQKNYNLVLDYELDDQMDLVFRGIEK